MSCHAYAGAPDTCALCPSLVTSRRQVVPSYGAHPARVLFIGEAPGYWGADRTGIPFHGDKSGKRLQKMLRLTGLSQGFHATTGEPLLVGCAVTNAVRCFPAKPGFPMRGRTPSKMELATCDPHLDADMAYWKPQVLVPIGAHALSACLNRYLPGDSRSITQLHALPVPIPQKQPSIMLPMRHPSRGSDSEFTTWVAAMQSLLESFNYGN